MKTATVREIRNAFPEVLRHIRNGETVAITYRRKIVASLAPPTASKGLKRRRPWAALKARLAELQKQPMLAVSGADLLAQDRDRY
jgi:antitoxin (DNA-binding transcriptional repressor) of toxin-antitoxin stability system